MYTVIKEKEYVALDEQIKEAKERQAKFEPGAAEQLLQYQQQKNNLQHEIRQVREKEFLKEVRAKKEKQDKLESDLEILADDIFKNIDKKTTEKSKNVQSNKNKKDNIGFDR